jgi:uncharacterized membrane protein
MYLARRMNIAALAALIGLGLCPASRAQVSCSPNVQVEKCKEVAKLLDIHLKLMPGTVQLELVSPAEYKARVIQFKKEFHLDTLETLGCGPGSEKLFFQNCVDIDVLFFRGSSSDVIPKRILVSSDEAADVLMLDYFVQGYYQGLTAEMAESLTKK